MYDEPRQRDQMKRQTFWSRRGGPDLSAEVDFDRPCRNCGYNLRGMPLRRRCPECGGLGSWGLYDDPIDFDDSQSLGAFIRTAAVVLFRPHLLAKHLWLDMRMNFAAARRFRRVAIFVAFISLCVVAFYITAFTRNNRIALASLPFQAAAILLWLNAVTLQPLATLKDWSGQTAIAQRVRTLVHYLSASLLLSPLHIPLALYLQDMVAQHAQGAWLLAAGIHVALLSMQLW